MQDIIKVINSLLTGRILKKGLKLDEEFKGGQKEGDQHFLRFKSKSGMPVGQEVSVQGQKGGQDRTGQDR